MSGRWSQRGRSTDIQKKDLCHQRNASLPLGRLYIFGGWAKVAIQVNAFIVIQIPWMREACVPPLLGTILLKARQRWTPSLSFIAAIRRQAPYRVEQARAVRCASFVPGSTRHQKGRDRRPRH